MRSTSKLLIALFLVTPLLCVVGTDAAVPDSTRTGMMRDGEDDEPGRAPAASRSEHERNAGANIPDVLRRPQPMKGYVPNKVTGEPLSMDEIQRCILRGCMERRWSARLVKEGVIVATINVRGVTAVAKITCDRESYLIYAAHGSNCGSKYFVRWASFLSQSINKALTDASLEQGS